MWAMNEADELVLAQKLDNIEAGVGQCAQGAVVKSNDACDMHIRNFIRGETGLLIDRTMEVSGILDASTKLDRGQTQAVFDEITRRWNTSDPFSMAVNTQRSLQNKDQGHQGHQNARSATMEGILMTENDDMMIRAIKRQAEILVLDLRRAPERLTQAQRAENIAALADKLING